MEGRGEEKRGGKRMLQRWRARRCFGKCFLTQTIWSFYLCKMIGGQIMFYVVLLVATTEQPVPSTSCTPLFKRWFSHLPLWIKTRNVRIHDGTMPDLQALPSANKLQTSKPRVLLEPSRALRLILGHVYQLLCPSLGLSFYMTDAWAMTQVG